MSKKMAAMVVQLSPYVTSLDIQEFTATYWVSTEDLRVECDPNLDPEVEQMESGMSELSQTTSTSSQADRNIERNVPITRSARV
ncbi:hypothetical protein Q1695_006537 [Nippostrongylus brasiliensis]|nr:hypothetical protein Q1695_006537 [Nippostrongylus brasiliensis]